jgi:hypothetical protein
MALMYDVVYDKNRKRHMLEFINQQFDFLMSIEYDDELGRYKFVIDEAEAKRIGKNWGGREFDIEYWLNLATKELIEADKKLLKDS